MAASTARHTEKIGGPYVLTRVWTRVHNLGMTTTANLLPGMTVRFVPANKKNRQTITVTKVEPLRSGALILGTRTVEAGTRYERQRPVCVIANHDTAIEVV